MGFFFSFIGSIPPGSINLSVIQLSIQRHLGAAMRFALSAALVEFVYAAVAIKLQLYITSQPAIQSNLKLISALVLVLLGILNLVSLRASTKNKNPEQIPKVSGFRKGLLISMANPLAIPFWIVVTAYLQSQGWVVFDQVSIWSYVAGISLGTLALLGMLALSGYKASKFINKDNKYIKIVPGVVLLTLGLYALGELLFA